MGVLDGRVAIISGGASGIAGSAPRPAGDMSSVVNAHALVVDSGLRAGRGGSVTPQRNGQLRAAFGAQP